jgi:hypothetical protein
MCHRSRTSEKFRQFPRPVASYSHLTIEIQTQECRYSILRFFSALPSSCEARSSTAAEEERARGAGGGIHMLEGCGGAALRRSKLEFGCNLSCVHRKILHHRDLWIVSNKESVTNLKFRLLRHICKGCFGFKRSAAPAHSRRPLNSRRLARARPITDIAGVTITIAIAIASRLRLRATTSRQRAACLSRPCSRTP